MTIFQTKRGTNQHAVKVHTPVVGPILATTIGTSLILLMIIPITGLKTTKFLKGFTFGQFPAVAVAVEPNVAGTSAEMKLQPTLPNIVEYIAEKWEKHGTGEVVKAINCFYSESGLRPTATNTNNDSHKSTDHGIAQLNDYWHKLTDTQKTDFIANIDKAYEIYHAHGNKFAVENGGAWYGRGCK